MTVTSVDEAAGIINVDIPNDTPSVLLRYVVASSGGGLGAPAYAVGTREWQHLQHVAGTAG